MEPPLTLMTNPPELAPRIPLPVVVVSVPPVTVRLAVEDAPVEPIPRSRSIVPPLTVMLELFVKLCI